MHLLCATHTFAPAGALSAQLPTAFGWMTNPNPATVFTERLNWGRREQGGQNPLVGWWTLKHETHTRMLYARDSLREEAREAGCSVKGERLSESERGAGCSVEMERERG